MPIAVNPETGEYRYLAEDGEWRPAQTAVHPQTKEKAGRTPFKDIKTMKDDAAQVEKLGDEIKARYTQLFKV